MALAARRRGGFLNRQIGLLRDTNKKTPLSYSARAPPRRTISLHGPPTVSWVLSAKRLTTLSRPWYVTRLTTIFTFGIPCAKARRATIMLQADCLCSDKDSRADLHMDTGDNFVHHQVFDACHRSCMAHDSHQAPRQPGREAEKELSRRRSHLPPRTLRNS